MPFTPFHLGPGLLFGLIFFPVLYLPCFLFGSIIVDIEPLVFLILDVPVLHQFFHTFLGATIAGIFLSLIILPFRKILRDFLTFFRLPQKASPLGIILASLISTNLHVLLDAFLYPEMHPFWPLLGNPLLGLFSSSTIYLFCILCFIGAIPLYGFHIWRIKSWQRNG